MIKNILLPDLPINNSIIEIEYVLLSSCRNPAVYYLISKEIHEKDFVYQVNSLIYKFIKKSYAEYNKLLIYDKAFLEKENIDQKYLDKIFQFSYEIGSSYLNEKHLLHFKEYKEEIKKVIDSLFDEMITKSFSHRKWIKLLNRISKKRCKEQFLF